MTEQEELKELADAEAEFLKHWDPAVGIKPSLFSAPRLRTSGADKRTIESVPAGVLVFSKGPAKVREWLAQRIQKFGEGTPSQRRRRLLTLLATAKQLNEIGRQS